MVKLHLFECKYYSTTKISLFFIKNILPDEKLFVHLRAENPDGLCVFIY